MRSIQEIVAQFPSDAAAYAEVTGERREKFEVWMGALEYEHQQAGQPYGKAPIAENTGPMCWLSWFDDGYTPKEALEGDLSNA